MDYETFLNDYRAFIGRLPGTVNLPLGWWQNWRGWDMWQAHQRGMGETVLDTGALHTFGCLYWAARGAQVMAIDSYYWAGRESHADLMTPYEWECVVEVTSGGRVMPQQADVTNIPFGDAAFDTVLSLSTVEHVDDDRAALAEMVRVLKPGGLLHLTTEYHETQGKPYSEDDGSFYRVYTASSLARLLAGYTVRARVTAEPRDPFTTVYVCVEKML